MIETEQARREGLRWVLLQVVNKARPYPANDQLLWDVGHSLYPDMTMLELQKELLFLEGLSLVRLTRPPARSWTTTLEIVDDCLRVEALGGSARWVILSRGERQAKEAMEEGVKKHCQAYGLAIREIEGSVKGPGSERYTMLEAVLPGGSRITALPANPDTARGFAANVFLDEFAFRADSRKIWAALFPVISNDYKLRVTSTPNGKDNKFYALMTDPSLDSVWSRHRVDIHQAVKDGLPRDVAALKQALNDEDAWAQEFELHWLDEAAAWLSYDLIDGVEHTQAGKPAHYHGGPCFVGVDIGLRHDLFVIWVIEPVGDVYWTRDIITRKRAPFAEQDALLDGVFAHYRVLRCCMDQTGLGEKPVEDAKRRHGSTRVEGVLFTPTNKLTLATRGKEAFEDRRLRLPQGDGALRADLHKLKKVMSPTGAPRFVAESDAAGHADRALGAVFGTQCRRPAAGASTGLLLLPTSGLILAGGILMIIDKKALFSKIVAE